VVSVDVLVVGAGPTGLMAAGDLARAGRCVTVLERWPAINPSSRAFATMPRTLELLDSRGLADDLLAQGRQAPGVTIFGGARIDLTHLDSVYRFVLVTPQANVDAALARYASSTGADIRRGIEVIDLDQDPGGVTVTARPHGDDAAEHRTRWRAKYVIGADGAHSRVRALVGADFPGKKTLSSMVLADVKLAHGPTSEGLTLGTTRDALGFLAPYDRHDADGSWYRAMTWDRNHQVPDTEPVDDGEIVDVLTRAMKRDHGVVEISWKSRFHCEERQVVHYRHGRVFLAGDAAHIHSPMGGQGMNTGIQDAANLAWKVDAALDGAGEAVLDSYHDERHPIGKRVLLQSGFMARGATLHPRAARWLRDLVLPRLLAVPRVRDTVAGSFAGTTLRYRNSRSALAGTRATGIPLTEGRLSLLQRNPGFVLVREHGARRVDSPQLLQAQRADEGPAVLVRPDGYIAWSGDSADCAGWAAELRWWTGRLVEPAAPV